MWNFVSNVSYDLVAAAMGLLFMLAVGDRILSSLEERARLRRWKAVGERSRKQIEYALTEAWLKLNWTHIKAQLSKQETQGSRTRLFQGWADVLSNILQRTAKSDGSYNTKRLTEDDQNTLETMMKSWPILSLMSARLRKAVEYPQSLPHRLVVPVVQALQDAESVAQQIGMRDGDEEFPTDLKLGLVTPFRDLIEHCQKVSDALGLRFDKPTNDESEIKGLRSRDVT